MGRLSLFRKLPTTCALLLSCALVALIARDQNGWFFQLVSDSESVGQWYRLISAQLTHTDYSHFLINALALLTLGSIAEPQGRAAFLGVVIIGFASVALWLIYFFDGRFYCGVSGVLNPVFVLTLLRLLDRSAGLSVGNLLVGLVGLVGLLKIVLELYSDLRLVTAGSWPSAPGSHLAGYIGGLICVLVGYRWRQNLTAEG